MQGLLWFLPFLGGFEIDRSKIGLLLVGLPRNQIGQQTVENLLGWSELSRLNRACGFEDFL